MKYCLTSKFVLVCLLSASCASRYAGPLPDTTKKGSAAREEIDKFTLDESIWSGPAYRMGPEKTRYFDLTTVIASVSPDAVKKMDQAEKWQKAEIYVLLGSLVCVLIPAFTTDRHTYQPLYWSAAGFYAAAVGVGLTSGAKYKSAAEIYNRDLRAKLAPTANVTWRF